METPAARQLDFGIEGLFRDDLAYHCDARSLSPKKSRQKLLGLEKPANRRFRIMRKMYADLFTGELLAFFTLKYPIF